MRRFHSNRSSGNPRRFVPNFERLEARDQPAVGVGVFGHALLVQGDANANTVSISDDGHGNVTATIDGKSASGAGINKIIVDTGAGNDTVNYKLTGALAVSEAVFIELGKGTDAATLDFTAGVNKGNLAVKVEGAGTDTITASFGSIAAGASASARFEGGAGNDTITTTFTGQLDGSLGLAAEGQGGNDTIATNVTIAAGSVGKLEAKVEGDGGTDNLTLNVVDNTVNSTTGKTGLARLKASIEGGPNDTITHTSNVKVEVEH